VRAAQVVVLREDDAAQQREVRPQAPGPAGLAGLAVEVEPTRIAWRGGRAGEFAEARRRVAAAGADFAEDLADNGRLEDAAGIEAVLGRPVILNRPLGRGSRGRRAGKRNEHHREDRESDHVGLRSRSSGLSPVK
jgi:hypothetical protein